MENGFLSYPADPASKIGSIIGDIIAAGILALIVVAIIPTLMR